MANIFIGCCDDYEDGDVMISIIMNFNAQNSQNFPKKFIF